MKKFTATTTKICKLCGNPFLPETRAQKYCKNEHTRPCIVCGEPITIHCPSDQKVCCSKACSLKLRQMNSIEHWGVDNPAKADVVKAKQAETCKIRYGVTTPFLASDFKSKLIQTSLAKYGTEYPMQADEIKSKQRHTLQLRYGVNNATDIPVVRDATKSYYTDASRLQSAAKKRAETTKVIASDGTKLDSEYERVVYEFCLRNSLNVSRQIPITYEYEGVSRVTFIDFCIEGQLVECKGSHLLQGCYDHFKYIVPIEAKLQVYRDNNVAVVTDSLAQDWIKSYYITDTEHRLKFIDLALFAEPEFPFRSDRPACFYYVKVNNHRSIFDAFQSDLIRYKMILNRIKYTSHFIDAKEIINALNITKLAKQPSWFSKTFAKHLISTYCSSTTVVDPFAGWGTRCDAAQELRLDYMGVELNPELVDWHHTQGRSNIQQGDARSFKYDLPCSVIMCPPYFDTVTQHTVEDYNYVEFDSNMQQITECRWLEIIMQNIPNASEYILVCKTVADKFKPYIVETKQNSSHLGTAVEYVVVVNQCDVKALIDSNNP